MYVGIEITEHMRYSSVTGTGAVVSFAIPQEILVPCGLRRGLLPLPAHKHKVWEVFKKNLKYIVD